MGELTGSTITYKSHDTPGIDDRRKPVKMEVATRLLNKEIVPETLGLKVRNVLAYGATFVNLLLPRSVVRSCSSR